MTEQEKFAGLGTFERNEAEHGADVRERWELYRRRALVRWATTWLRGRGLEPEEPERGRGDVDQRRVVAVDRAVAEEDSGDESGIDAVIPTPRLDVVLEDRARHNAGRAVPGDPVALLEPDDDIRPVLPVGAAISRPKWGRRGSPFRMRWRASSP